MKLLIPRCLTAFLLLMAPTAAQAAVRTFTMDGILTQVTPSPNSLPAFAAVGDHVTYTFTFDAEAQDTNPAPGVGSYAGISSQATIKDQTFAGQMPSIQVQYDSGIPGAPAWFHVESGLLVDGLSPFSSAVALFNLNDTNHSVLTGPNLPEEPYDPSLFASTSFTIKFYTVDGSVNYEGIIVPEPASFSLVLLSLLSTWRRRATI
jgi:hypothetical protein